MQKGYINGRSRCKNNFLSSQQPPLIANLANEMIEIKNNRLGENCLINSIKLKFVSLSARQEEIDWGASEAKLTFNKLLKCLA